MNRRKKSGRSFLITCAVLFSLIFIALIGGIVLSFVNVMPGKKASVNVNEAFQTNSAGYMTTGSVAYNDVIKLGSGAVAVSPTPSPTPTINPLMFTMLQSQTSNQNADDQDDQDNDNQQNGNQANGGQQTQDNPSQNTTPNDPVIPGDDNTTSIGDDTVVDETPTDYGDYDYVVYYDYGSQY